MRTGTRGFVGSVAEIFQVGNIGGSSTRASQSLTRDGDLEACSAANPLDRMPPPQCQSLLRVELVGLVDKPVEPPGPSGELVPLTPSCALGFVDVDGTCVPEQSAAAHRCEPTDIADCTSPIARRMGFMSASIGRARIVAAVSWRRHPPSEPFRI